MLFDIDGFGVSASEERGSASTGTDGYVAEMTQPELLETLPHHQHLVMICPVLFLGNSSSEDSIPRVS